MRLSLRTRVMLGAILWTGGLVALSFVENRFLEAKNDPWPQS